MRDHNKSNPSHKFDLADDDLDRLLTRHFEQEGCLAPSSGFALTVMDAVQAETGTLPPIAFPWGRVLPGAIAALCGLVAFAVIVVRQWTSIRPAADISPLSLVASAAAPGLGIAGQACCWTLVAACLSIAAVAASRRIAGRAR